MSSFYKRRNFAGGAKRRWSSTARRTYGQYKAAKRTNDQLSFVINSSYTFTARYEPGDEVGTAAINVWEVLANNSQFYNLKNMYDQVKIDGVRVNLSCTNASVNLNNFNSFSNTTVFTCWDRTGLSLDETTLFTKDRNNYTEIPPAQIRTTRLGAYRTKIGSKIVNKTGSEKSMINMFQKWKVFKSIYPSTINEKGQYIQTGDLKKFVEVSHPETSYIDLTESSVNDYYSLTGEVNPCIIFESSNCRFKPTLLVGVFRNEILEGGNVTQYGRVDTVVFTGEFSISVTFRNLKGAA